MRSWFVVGLLILLEALFAVTAVLSPAEPWVFYGAGIGGAVVWLLCIYLLQRDMPRWMTGVLVTSAVVMRLTVIGTGPIASDDMYRYMWDGKVQVHGLDPYQYAPSAEELSDLHSTLLPQNINFPGMRTVYPPLAQWVFAATYAIGGESILAFKVPLLIADLLSIALLLLLLRRIRRKATDVALYAINPLVILQFMVDGHLDALAFPFILAFLLLYHHRSRLASMLALGFSIIVKPLSVIFLPFVLRDDWKERRLWILLAVSVPALAYLPYLLGGGAPFESLGVYTARWSFNGSIFRLLYLLVGSNEITRILTFGFMAVVLVQLTRKEHDLISAVANATFAFLILAATVHPWYLAWLAVLLPLYPRWSMITFVATIAFANFSGVWNGISGEWTEPLWMGLAVYLPVLAVALLEKTGIVPLPEPTFRYSAYSADRFQD